MLNDLPMTNSPQRILEMIDALRAAVVDLTEDAKLGQAARQLFEQSRSQPQPQESASPDLPNSEDENDPTRTISDLEEETEAGEEAEAEEGDEAEEEEGDEAPAAAAKSGRANGGTNGAHPDVSEQVLELVQRTPSGIAAKDIANKLKIKRPVVLYHLAELRKRKLVRVEGKTRSRVFLPHA
jgi:DNA-binding transcriptional ArsR family regulator